MQKTKHAMYVQWPTHLNFVDTSQLLERPISYCNVQPLSKQHTHGSCTTEDEIEEKHLHAPVQHNVEQVWNASPVAICYSLLGQVIIEDDLRQQDREMFRKQLHYSDNRVSWRGNRFLKKSKQDIYQWFGETQRPGDKTQQFLGSTHGVLPKNSRGPKAKCQLSSLQKCALPKWLIRIRIIIPYICTLYI